MQRVRIGLTGLAVVFLLVVLAAVVIGTVTREAVGLEGNSALVTDSQSGEAAPSNAADEPREPLAELGVTPGNAPADEKAAPAKKATPSGGN